MQTWLPYVVALAIVGLVIWIRSKRRGRPVRGNGLGMIAPVLVLIVLMLAGLYQLMHIPGTAFHLPAYWEIGIAGLLGTLFGVIILKQTSYEKREDGLIYPKPNKYFKYVIIALVLIRVALAQYFKGMDPLEFAFLTMVLAIVYLSIWRIGSYVKFQQIFTRPGTKL